MARTTKPNVIRRGELAVISVPSDRLTFGVGELASALGVCTNFVRLEISRGKLRALKRGRRILIPRTVMEAYLSDSAA